MLSAWLPERERVRAQSLMWSFTRWGGAVTPPLALLCIRWVGWRWAFVSFAALGFLWCLLFLVWFKDDPAQHPSVNAAELELLEASRALTRQPRIHRHWTSLLLTRQVLLLFVQYFFLSYVWCFYITWLPTYLREGRAQSPERAAALAVLPLLFGGFGSLASGLAPARLPRRAIAFCGFLATAILLVVLTHIQSVLPAMLAMGLASLSSDLTMPISWDACVEIGGPYTATVAAAMNMMGNLAGFVAPVVGGVILEKTGNNWNILIDTMAVAALVSASCWLSLDPESARKQRALAPTSPPVVGAETLEP
jgi:sugar phosphate permease